MFGKWVGGLRGVLKRKYWVWKQCCFLENGELDITRILGGVGDPCERGEWDLF